jgi:hypothetical protein
MDKRTDFGKAWGDYLQGLSGSDWSDISTDFQRFAEGWDCAKSDDTPYKAVGGAFEAGWNAAIVAKKLNPKDEALKVLLDLRQRTQQNHEIVMGNLNKAISDLCLDD